jgi:phage FluMu protein Com
MLDKALAAEIEAECPRCKTKLKVKVPGDSDLLKHLDNRVSGKAVTKLDVDMSGKVELTGNQLVAISTQVQQYIVDVRAHDITVLQQQVATLPPRTQIEGGMEEGGSGPGQQQ